MFIANTTYSFKILLPVNFAVLDRVPARMYNKVKISAYSKSKTRGWCINNMNIDMKEKLRELRKKKNVTQEALANHLGITPQSVGKWERGEGFPDITLLPAIALYFGITVDELLGVDQARIDEKLAAYDREAHEYLHAGKVSDAIAVRERAYKEFPNDLGAAVDLMNDLYFENVAGQREHTERIIELGERILDESRDTRQRESAIQILTYVYHDLGDKETALKYADMGGDLYTTSYDLRASVLDGEEGIKCAQSYIQNLLLLCSLSARSLSGKADMTTEEKIKALEFAVAVRLLPFDADENVGYAALGVSQDLCEIASYYARLEKYEESFDALERAARYAVDSTMREKRRFKSFIVNRIEEDPSRMTKNYEGNACDLRLGELRAGEFDAMRGDERFARIKAELEAHAELAHGEEK